GSIEKIGERFASFHTFGDGAGELLKIFDSRNIVGSIAILQHVQVAGFFEHRMKECRRLLFPERVLQLEDELLESAKRGDGAAARPSGNKLVDGGPEGSVGVASGFTQRVDAGFANAARGKVKHAKEGNIVFRMHGQANVGESVFHFRA